MAVQIPISMRNGRTLPEAGYSDPYENMVDRRCRYEFDI